MEDRTPVNTSDFLVETIKTRPTNSRHMMKRVLEVGALAILFGIIACFTMIIVSPIMEERFFPEPTSEVSFPEDPQTPLEEEVEPEDMLLEEEAETVPAVVEEPDGQTQLLRITYMLSEKARECQDWLVEVTGVSNETSWLESTGVRSNVTSGAIVADNGTELLILTESADLAGADFIEVTLAEGVTTQAVIKGEDKDAGIMIVAVAKEQVDPELLTDLLPVEMASSNNKKLVGSTVMALGSPNGIQGSVQFGLVTAMGVEINSWDSNYRLVMTDMYGSSSPNGFLVNLKGQLVGILCNRYNEKSMENSISALGISELKKKIERMSNGEEIPLLGIKAIEVTEEVHIQDNIPYGAYVTNIKMDSPAMQAGIQAGDLIVSVGEKDVNSMYTLAYLLQQMKVDEKISVTLKRLSQGAYRDITLEITLSRQ